MVGAIEGRECPRPFDAELGGQRLGALDRSVENPHPRAALLQAEGHGARRAAGAEHHGPSALEGGLSLEGAHGSTPVGVESPPSARLEHERVDRSDARCDLVDDGNVIESRPLVRDGDGELTHAQRLGAGQGGAERVRNDVEGQVDGVEPELRVGRVVHGG